MHDLVIRAGTVVDGTGRPGYTADIAIDNGTITEVGNNPSRGRQELDADGLLVTPGFVDIHTHYDGQVSWDPDMTPSVWHGVTTVVMGNCGVGFAPVRPGSEEWLIGLMEGVEDIPGAALAEGIEWEWESFPEYLDAVERKPRTIDVAAQVPHGALRAYVMGERGADHHSHPTSAEIAEMARLAAEGVAVGAVGFTTSRTVNHKTKDGEHTPSLTAGADELWAIAEAVGQTGKGVFEMVGDWGDLDAEFDLVAEMARVSGRPLSMTIAVPDSRPDLGRQLLERIALADAAGIPLRAQVASRPVGVLVGLQSTYHALLPCPSYHPIAALDLDERVARLRQPEVRERLVAELAAQPVHTFNRLDKLFPLGQFPDYEPSPDASVAADAVRRGVDPHEALYDALLARDGTELLYVPVMNYGDGDFELTKEMLAHPLSVPGLGDAGAHVGFLCDGSMPSFLLSHWGRNRTRGETLPVEQLVKWQCADTSALIGFDDRGTLAAGQRADINLIDFDQLKLRAPEMVFDLPAGGRRLIQRANGFVATLVAGQTVLADGELTGARPGRLVRS
ncbi:N-acyl-D-amino-acid deacylase family protein [Candidatus Poriferisocius sp.]|uniref:N-acyl-D-amino-acid deacylase family protein n=1 Tax=Candidatus Poriferisocius sp. TaxID=3101276 RepID=UPI003B028BBD